MATRPLTALAGFVAAQAALSLSPANALELYTIEGYMDRTLSQAQVISRSEASSSKTRRGICRHGVRKLESHLLRGPKRQRRPEASLAARTSGKRCTSPMKRASKGEVLSRLHARASRRGTFKSTTGKMATVSGHRHRALPRTHPTPKPVDTRLKIVASFSPS